jgi:acetyltransferase-like isoleucine patch superfamily enzyme
MSAILDNDTDIAELLVNVPARPSTPPAPVTPRLFVFQLYNYFTNQVIARIPSFSLRHLWYRRALSMEIGERTWIHLGCYLWFYGRRENRRKGASIGASSRINRSCTLDLRGGLHIGENVSVSPEVMILTGSHDMDDPGFALIDQPVVIEDFVWIGTRAMIMPGVTIGRGAVVAAGSIVTRNVAPMTVVAGVPARPVGVRRTPSFDYAVGGGVPPLFE